jgi:hypothetical protein
VYSGTSCPDPADQPCDVPVAISIVRFAIRDGGTLAGQRIFSATEPVLADRVRLQTAAAKGECAAFFLPTGVTTRNVAPAGCVGGRVLEVGAGLGRIVALYYFIHFIPESLR